MRSICLIGNYLHYSGALEVFRGIAEHMKGLGWSTAYAFHAARPGDVPPDMGMFDEVCPMPLREGEDRDVYGLTLAKYANAFDVVHTSLLPIDWRYTFKRHVERPMVETYHSPDGWKWCWSQYRWRLKGGHERLADAMVAVSRGLGKKMEADLREAGHNPRVLAIYNGVRIPEMAAHGGNYITYCGRISKDKGLEDWLKIAEELHRRIPEARFQWVGELSPQYDDTAFRWLQAACPWLECVGFHADPSPFYRRSFCTLLTSPSEGLPMSILESHAHGVPAFAHHVGDVAESGAIEVHGVEHAIEAIEFYWRRRDWATSDADAMRERARQCFSIDRMGNSYASLYAYLLEPACV